MKVLVTGSAGHLGEALVRALGSRVTRSSVSTSSSRRSRPRSARSSIATACALHGGGRRVLHTATLHKPHVGCHDRQAFVDTNVTGTLNLLEEAVAAGVEQLRLHEHDERLRTGAHPAAGRTRRVDHRGGLAGSAERLRRHEVAAEDLCELVHREHGLPCLVLRTSRFFPEDDDREDGDAYDDANVKVNELLYRRVDIADVVEPTCSRWSARRNRLRSVHRQRDHAVLAERPRRAADGRPAVVARHVPGYEDEYAAARLEDVP